MLTPSFSLARRFSFSLALALIAAGCCRGSSDAGGEAAKTSTPKASPAPDAPPKVVKTQAQIDACKAQCTAKYKEPRDRLQCYIPCMN